MCVVAIHCRVTRVTAHMFGIYQILYGKERAVGTRLITFVIISELLCCLCYKIALINFPVFASADL